VPAIESPTPAQDDLEAPASMTWRLLLRPARASVSRACAGATGPRPERARAGLHL